MIFIFSKVILWIYNKTKEIYFDKDNIYLEMEQVKDMKKN